MINSQANPLKKTRIQKLMAQKKSPAILANSQATTISRLRVKKSQALLADLCCLDFNWKEYDSDCSIKTDAVWEKAKLKDYFSLKLRFFLSAIVGHVI